MSEQDVALIISQIYLVGVMDSKGWKLATGLVWLVSYFILRMAA